MTAKMRATATPRASSRPTTATTESKWTLGQTVALLCPVYPVLCAFNDFLCTAAALTEEQRKAQRAQRFGLPVSSAALSAQAAKEARKERFGIVTPDDARKKREERFGKVAKVAHAGPRHGGVAKGNGKAKGKFRRAQQVPDAPHWGRACL